jgi:hypothetical protein
MSSEAGVHVQCDDIAKRHQAKGISWIMLRIARHSLWIAFGLAAIVGLVSPAVSKALVPSDDEWRAAHIEGLPGEVSREVYKWQGSCGLLRARSSFSRITEIAGHRYLALHFEHLHCEDRAAICSA